MNPVIITGSRADYYHLKPLIEKSGWDVVKGVALYPVFDFRWWDMVVLLGDRYEILMAAIEAYKRGIPIAHIHGGERTDGSLDDGYRHCITKLSHLHFVAHLEYAMRVMQLGEHPDRIYTVGCLRFDREEETYTPEATPYAIAVYNEHTGEDFKDLLVEVTESRDDVRFIWPDNLGDQFTDALRKAAFIIGNSSAGIIEAPHVQTPTINIGDRQKGRIMGRSIINVEPDRDQISLAIAYCMTEEFEYDDEYYHGGAVDKIIEVIENYEHRQKTFCDLWS